MIRLFASMFLICFVSFGCDGTQKPEVCKDGTACNVGKCSCECDDAGCKCGCKDK